jgi:hypothetical protein
VNRALNILGILACALGAVLAATITTLLTPLYWGGQVVPLAILLAVVANVVFPLLVRWLGLSPLAAAVPFALWLITVLVLASSRPEGDVLLPVGKGGQQAVTYGMLLGGAVAGGVTIARLMVNSVAERVAADAEAGDAELEAGGLDAGDSELGASPRDRSPRARATPSE